MEQSEKIRENANNTEAAKIAAARADVQRWEDAVANAEAKAKAAAQWWEAGLYKDKTQVYRAELLKAREWLRILTA